MRKKKDDGKRKSGQRKDGRFQTSKRMPDGSRRFGYGQTLKEAQEDLARKVAEAEQGILPSTKKLKVAQYMEEYLARRSLDLRANASYRWLMNSRRHIIPSLGHIPLRDLETRHVQDWIVRLSKSGLKPSSVHTYFTVLRVAMNDAVKTRLIVRSPCDHITLPTVKKPERSILSPEQLRKLLDVLEYPWLAFFVVAFSTGMRKGELLSLKWEDINFSSGTLRVHRNVAQVPSSEDGPPLFVEDGPKSESSNRTIVLQAFALKALEAHRVKQKEQKFATGPAVWKENGLVFAAKDGAFLHVNYPNRALEKALKEAGLEETNVVPHGARHTLASQLLGRRFNPKVVQEILGHSDIRMTIGMYGHALPNAHEEAMEEMDHVFWNQEKEAK